ncbi:hypothetical protein MAR_024295 [Mya arenaria]|uniref:Uncharacterized protein n=1 Tax=Mya arenaria TaxID=6604 RepID=A0ABY7DQE4_MYAAR|nr:hypothetical protein MAR_024295 [Mya arenaria]
MNRQKSIYYILYPKERIPALVFKEEDEAFFGGRVNGPLQKGVNRRYFYKVRYNGENKDHPVDWSDFELRAGARSWRKLKPGDRVLAETISTPIVLQNTSCSSNMIDEQRSAFVQGIVKRLPIPADGIRRYKVVMGSGKKIRTLHLSRKQIKPLGGNIEAEKTDNRPAPIRPDIQPVKIPTKDKNTQTPESEPVSGVVLARWRDDGWFYFGKVVSSKEDEYSIKDGFGLNEMIHKSDVLTETNQKFQVVQISDQKYADYVHHIKQKEKEMLQANVIVLDEKCGHFENGTVSDYIDNQMFTVTLTARNEARHLEQQANHMFLRGTILSTDVDLKSLKYVIGRVNDVFLSGEICKSTNTNGKKMPDETITVLFCNHEKTSVRLDDVYPINKYYFDLAVNITYFICTGNFQNR